MTDTKVDAPHVRDLICAFAVEHGGITREDAYDLEGRHDRLGHAAAGRALRDLTRDGYLVGPDDDGVWAPTERAADGWTPVPTDGTSVAGAAIVVSEHTGDDPVNGGGTFGRHRPPPSTVSPDDRIARILEQADALEAAGELDDAARELVRQARAAHAEDWRLRVPALFPRMVKSDFAPHQDELWDWVWSVNPPGDMNQPEPFVALWPRGHAKSASAEMACVTLGHRRRRRYCLYVSGTQSKADDHVLAIADLLESPEVAQIDPELCERRVGMYGQSKGWRHNRLTTQAGFTVDAVGLDVDVRGARIDDARPDLIIFDDIDSVTDTPAIIERKLLRITRDLIPAGSQDLVILFAQNVIHNTSIAARLGGVDGAPDPGFLYTRRVSGPVPAVTALEFSERYDDDLDRNRVFITGGVPTWDGYDIDACQHMIDREGIVAFLAECQHEQGTLKGGLFDHIDFNVRRATRAELPALRPVDAPDGYDHPTWIGPCSVWCDPAVTSTDKSDACAVTVGGIAPDRKMWALYAWEQIASPEEAMRVALDAGMRWGAQVCGFETDQGGDTWEVVYRKVVADMLSDPDSYLAIRHAHGVPIPRYDYAKAGGTEGNLSKRQRINMLVARYDLDEFRHLDGAAAALEAGLSRFPKYKPFDIADSWWHNWRWMSRQRGGESGGRGYKGRNPARRQGPLPDVTPS